MRIDSPAESWPLAEPDIAARDLMLRLTIKPSDLYPAGAQLLNSQRLPKTRRAQWVR
jgi:hypothetical protein